MIDYTVELRKDNDTKTVFIRCKQNQVIGTIADKYPGWQIVRYY